MLYIKQLARLSIFIHVDILVLVSEFVVVVGADHCGHISAIQGWPPFEGRVYYTEASSMRLLFNNYNLIELKNE